jgi:hypothetical protein
LDPLLICGGFGLGLRRMVYNMLMQQNGYARQLYDWYRETIEEYLLSEVSFLLLLPLPIRTVCVSYVEDYFCVVKFLEKFDATFGFRG